MDNIKSNKLNTHFYRGAENHNPKPSKHNTKLDKHNNKPVNAIFIIALSLFGLTSISAFGLMSSNSHADTTSAQASVTVPDTCYMSSNSTTHTGTATGGSYKENFGGESTVTVICNDRNGYSVYAIGCSGSDTTNCSDTNKTKLIGASTNLTIPTGLSTDGSTSNWAMKLTPVTGSFAPTILNGYNNYSLVPATATKVATLTSDINISNSSQFKTSYAVAIASSQAADTYVGKVKYTVVHPNYVTPSGDLETYPVTLGFGANTSSIVIDGTTYTSSSSTPNLTYGTHTISGTYPSGYEFSSWSSTGNITIADSTSASTTISVAGAGTLTLNGKASQYNLVITSDANVSAMSVKAGSTSGTSITCTKSGTKFTCSNLTYGTSYYLYPTFNSGYEFSSWTKTDSATNAQLGSTSTMNTYYKMGAGAGALTLNGKVSCTPISGTMQAFSPTATTCESGTLTDARDSKTYTVKKISGQWWMTQNLRYLGDTNSAAKTMTIGNNNSNVANKSITLYSLNSSNAGNFNAYSGHCDSTYGYDYACVYDSGGTSKGVWYNYYAATAGTISTNSNQNEATSDICPKNWHLPSYNTSSPAGSINSITSQSTAFSPVTGGYYYNSSLTFAKRGYWWSSTAQNATYRRILYYDGSSLNASSSVYRYYGVYVRCTRTS